MTDLELSEIEIKDLIFSECKALEIKAKKFADASISGAYKSLKKGTGIEFEETRLYTPSDDSRRIDWKVTARRQKPYIKSFREERDQNIILLVDGTPSTLLGIETTKSRRILEISAFIGSIASFNQDNIGSLIFSGGSFSFNKAKRSFSGVYKILHDIIATWHQVDTVPQNQQIQFNEILFKLSKLVKRKSQIFIISDFNFPIEFESALKAISLKHDIYCISVEDSLESNLPNSGKFLLKDPESGEEIIINFSNKKSRDTIINEICAHREQIDKLFKRQKIPYLKLNDKSDVRSNLFSFFKEQSRKHG